MRLEVDYYIYIVNNNKGEILNCFCNEENAQAFAVRECFKFIEENETNKSIFDKLEETECYEEKLEIIHEFHMQLIINGDSYNSLANVETFLLQDSDCIFEY